MKYFLIAAFAVLAFMSPRFSFASSISTTPASTTNFSANTITVANGVGDNNYIYIFDNSGNSLYDYGSALGKADGTYTVSALTFIPSITSVGRYFMAFPQGGATNLGPTFDAQCGLGHTFSACESYANNATTSFDIISGGGGGGSTTVAIAPINNRTSTAVVAGNVTAEIISFPLYILKTYGGPLTWMAIIFALVGAIYGITKLVRL